MIFTGLNRQRRIDLLVKVAVWYFDGVERTAIRFMRRCRSSHTGDLKLIFVQKYIHIMYRYTGKFDTDDNFDFSRVKIVKRLPADDLAALRLLIDPHGYFVDFLTHN